jgi:hypothetical protein
MESGESKDVDASVVSEYKTNLLRVELIHHMNPKNVYNTDETGFFSGVTNKIARS